MIFITIDTCVWLGLIKEGLNTDNNVFEEFCFWIENKYLTHIVPENIVREWDRRKVAKTIEIIGQIEKIQRNAVGEFNGNSDLQLAYQPDAIEKVITDRINRIDAIFKAYSEIAVENEAIYSEATKRNLNCIAPNHTKDSFRDTINILSLIHYIKSKPYKNCYFTTINYKDFSDPRGNKHTLHPDLVNDFKDANLEFVYCDESPFANKLLDGILRPSLVSFQDYLKNKQREAEEKLLLEKKTFSASSIANPDKDYLENIKYIDLIIAKKERTAVDEDILKLLINRHASYMQYFLKNIGNNGLV